MKRDCKGTFSTAFCNQFFLLALVSRIVLLMLWYRFQFFLCQGATIWGQDDKPTGHSVIQSLLLETMTRGLGFGESTTAIFCVSISVLQRFEEEAHWIAVAKMDDEVLDSWEDAADTGDFEKRMEQREKELRVQEEIEKQSEARAFMKGTIVPQEEIGKSEYVPQIKILKRQNGPATQDVKQTNKKPLKTLAEKEAEYAAARARILGDFSNTPPEQEATKVILTNDTSLIGRRYDSSINDELLTDEYKR